MSNFDISKFKKKQKEANPDMQFDSFGNAHNSIYNNKMVHGNKE